MDRIEMRDLQDVKERMKVMKEPLCILQEKVGHIEGKHCKRG